MARFSRRWLFASVATLITVATVIYWRWPSKPAGRSVTALAEAASLAPADTLLLIATRDFNRGEFREMVEEAARHNEAFAALIRDSIPTSSIPEEKDLRAQGIDSNAVAFGCARDANFEKPALVLSVGVTDPVKAEAYIRKALAETSLPGMSSEGVRFLVEDGRLYCSAGADAEQTLMKFLADAKASNLAAQDRFRSSVKLLPEAQTAWYLNFGALRRSLAHSWFHEWPIFNAIDSVSASSDDESTTVQLEFDPSSRVLAMLEPGGVCAEFISRFEPPVVTLTWSLKDPGGILDVMRPTDGSSERPQANGLTREQMGALLKDGCGAALFYPAATLMPESVVCFRVNDEALALSGARETCTATGGQERIIQTTPLFLKKNGESTTVVSSHVVKGKAERLETVIGCDTKKWTPVVGGHDILAAEISVKPLLAALTQREPAEVQKAFSTSIPDDLRVTMKLRRHGGSIVIQFDYRGVARTMIECLANAAPHLQKKRM